MKLLGKNTNGLIILILGILLIAIIIGLVVVYLLKRQPVKVEPITEGFQTSDEDISSQIHFRFLQPNYEPALYLNLGPALTDTEPNIPKLPFISEYNQATSNGLYKIIENKDDYDLKQVATVYFRLQPVGVDSKSTKFYKFVYDRTDVAKSGFIIEDLAKQTDETPITVFSIKRGDKRQLNIHNVKYGDFKNLIANRAKFYVTGDNTTTDPATWFTVLVLSTSSTTEIPAVWPKVSSPSAKLLMAINPATSFITESNNFAQFSPIPRVHDLSGNILFDKSTYVQGAKLVKDPKYPNTHYRIMNIETGKVLRYVIGDRGGKLEYADTDATDKAQIFGVTQARNISPDITNPGLMVIVPIIEAVNIRIDPTKTILNIVTVAEGGFQIIEAENEYLNKDVLYLEYNSVRSRPIYEYSLSTILSGTTSPYYIQYPISIINNSQIAMTTIPITNNSAIPYVSIVSAGKDNQIYIYTNGFLLKISKGVTAGSYALGLIDNLVEASPISIDVVKIGTTTTKNYTLTDVASKAAMTIAMSNGQPYGVFKDSVADASKAKFNLSVSTAPTTSVDISEDISTAKEYLAEVDTTPETSTTEPTTTSTTTTTTTTAAAGGTTTTAANTTTTTTASQSKLSDKELAHLSELEKVNAMFADRIQELVLEKQDLETQLNKLKADEYKLSANDNTGMDYNSKLRTSISNKMDKVVNMIEKLKALSATSAAASNAAHGYTQQGGSVRKADTGVSVSDYEGVLNIFYPQFM